MLSKATTIECGASDVCYTCDLATNCDAFIRIINDRRHIIWLATISDNNLIR